MRDEWYAVSPDLTTDDIINYDEDKKMEVTK